MKKVLSESINLLKIVATILVVLGHSTRMNLPNGPFATIIRSEFLANLNYLIYSFHMPLWMFISGCLFSLNLVDLHKYKDRPKFIKSKFNKLIIPYIFIGIFYVAPTVTALRLTPLRYWEFVFDGIILAHDTRHLWYLLILFSTFLIFIYVEKIIRNVNPLIILFTLVLISYYHGYGIWIFGMIMHFLLYFYLGFLANVHFRKIKNYIFLNNFVVPFFMLSFAICYFYRQYFPLDVLNILLGITGVLSSFGISLLLCKFNLIKGTHPLYKNIVNNSFGIYLFHPMIIYVIFFFTKGLPINTIFLSFISFIIAFICSDILSLLIKKTKLKFILGE